MVESNKIDKILCPSCARVTNHEIAWKAKEKKVEDDEIGIWESTSYDVLQCLGCETVSLRREYMFSEDLNMRHINGEWIAFPNVTMWPKTSHRMLKQKQFSTIPPEIRRIYQETIDAYNLELPTLCAAGIRAIIERVCNNNDIKENDLEKKINSLLERGIITKIVAEGLHENRILGNTALHESKLFGDEELTTAINLIESLLEMMYETKNRTSLLKVFRENREKEIKTKIDN